MDQLAADGLMFRHAWSNPFCSATRATIQTGRYSFRTGIGHFLVPQSPVEFGLPLAETTLPEMLDQGTGGLYTHALIGKWHLGSPSVGGDLAPNLAGYDHFAGTISNISSYAGWPKTVNGATSFVNTYPATDKVDEAIAWLGGVSGPWMMVFNFNLPHVPFHAPPPQLHTVDLSGAGTPASDPRPHYKAMVQTMDTELGRLLAAVDARRDDTVVIFVGDNGTPGAVVAPPFDFDHGKGTLFEGGVHVPLIVRGPGVAAGAECDALVDTVDLFSTVADLAGVDLQALAPPLDVDGISITSYFSNPALPSLRRSSLAEIFQPAGPGAGLPIPAPPPFLCQDDLGFGGPGTASLSLCGQVLAQGLEATLNVRGAPAFAPAFIVFGLTLDPTPAVGGTLAPVPWLALVPVATNGFGEITLPGVTNLFDTGVDLYIQVGIFDPLLPAEWALTNAVKATFEPPHSKAIRNQRLKVVVSFYGAPDRVYDVAADPLEQQELLEAGLTPQQQADYQALKQILANLLATP
jgi:hypothetical protein